MDFTEVEIKVSFTRFAISTDRAPYLMSDLSHSLKRGIPGHFALHGPGALPTSVVTTSPQFPALNLSAEFPSPNSKAFGLCDMVRIGCGKRSGEKGAAFGSGIPMRHFSY